MRDSVTEGSSLVRLVTGLVFVNKMAHGVVTLFSHVLEFDSVLPRQHPNYGARRVYHRVRKGQSKG